MIWWQTLLLLIGLLALQFAIGTPVAFAFLGANLVGAWIFLGGEAGLMQLTRNASLAVNSFALAPIPLFILMGELLFHTGLAYRAIDAVEKLLVRLPARLSCVSVVGGTAFAALSGSSIANTAMLGGTLSQEMIKRGYSTTLALGPTMAVGGIAVLIPPSALAVMLGSLSGISISQLLIGGIMPGLLMAVSFLAFVIIVAQMVPSSAPREDVRTIPPLKERIMPFVRDVLPLSGIFIAVVGGMLAGIATPTESAALGSAAALIATIGYRTLTPANFIKSMVETAKVSISILFIIVASTTFSQILSFSGATTGFIGLIEAFDPSPAILVAMMLLIILILGCFIDQISIMMITLPFFMPLAQAAGVEPVWLGLMMLVAIELGLLTPPFGILLMVMQGVSRDTTLPKIYRAATPFILIELVILALMFMAPDLTLLLPNLLK